MVPTADIAAEADGNGHLRDDSGDAGNGVDDAAGTGDQEVGNDIGIIQFQVALKMHNFGGEWVEELSKVTKAVASNSLFFCLSILLW